MQIASTGVENAVSFTNIVSANTAIGRKALFRKAPTSVMKVEIANRPEGLLFANEFKTGDTAQWSRNGGPRNE